MTRSVPIWRGFSVERDEPERRGGVPPIETIDGVATANVAPRAKRGTLLLEVGS